MFSPMLSLRYSKVVFYLGVRICAISVFCFVSLCLRSVLNGLLASLFSLFYVIREFDGFFRRVA